MQWCSAYAGIVPYAAEAIHANAYPRRLPYAYAYAHANEHSSSTNSKRCDAGPIWKLR